MSSRRPIANLRSSPCRRCAFSNTGPVENARRVREVNEMLGEIRVALGFVPLKKHRHGTDLVHVYDLYIQLPTNVKSREDAASNTVLGARRAIRAQSS